MTVPGLRFEFVDRPEEAEAESKAEAEAESAGLLMVLKLDVVGVELVVVVRGVGLL